MKTDIVYNVYNDMTELVREFPVKNKVWMTLDSCFVANTSSLGIAIFDIKDPWNRPFPNDPRPQYNENKELVAWHLWTTVNRQRIKCVIFDD